MRTLIFITLVSFCGVFARPQSEERKFDSKSAFDEDEDATACKTVFEKYSYADCVVFDDDNCNTDETAAPIAIRSGEFASIESSADFANEIDSVSVRKGCEIKLFTGTDYSGEKLVLRADDGDLHFTLDTDGNPEEIQEFDDSINSFSCNCKAPVLHYRYKLLSPRTVGATIRPYYNGYLRKRNIAQGSQH